MEEWITVDLNPESNLLDALARNLYIIPEIKALFVKAKLDFSVLGIGVSLENAQLVASNEEDAIKMMLEVLKKAHKKLLVTIDEITYGNDVARFSHALSSYAGADYDIYVLMTGLKENIKAIKNQKSLTFLYRAKERELDSLNITAICSDYMQVLEVDREKAEELAYEKIWQELSEGDKKVLRSMNRLSQKSTERLLKVEDIREACGMTSNSFTKYRSRLLDSGIVDGKQFGYLSIKLPRFEKFIDMQMW